MTGFATPADLASFPTGSVVEKLLEAVVLRIGIHTIDEFGLITIRPRTFRKIPEEHSVAAIRELRRTGLVESAAGILADDGSGGYRGSGYKLTWRQGRDHVLSLRLLYGEGATRPKRLRRQAVAATDEIAGRTLDAIKRVHAGGADPRSRTSLPVCTCPGCRRRATPRQIAQVLGVGGSYVDFVRAALSILVREGKVGRKQPTHCKADGVIVGATYSIPTFAKPLESLHDDAGD